MSCFIRKLNLEKLVLFVRCIDCHFSVSLFEQSGAGMIFVARLQCPDPSPRPAALVVKQHSRKRSRAS